MRVTIHEYRQTESKRALLEELFAKYLYPGVTVIIHALNRVGAT